jgi:hypothetical protein
MTYEALRQMPLHLWSNYVGAKYLVLSIECLLRNSLPFFDMQMHMQMQFSHHHITKKKKKKPEFVSCTSLYWV